MSAAPRVAVVGHVEWTTHVRAPFFPRAGEIVYCEDPLEQPAGGGAVTACALARLGASEVPFYTALGADGRAREPLERRGVTVLAAMRPEAQTPALVVTDQAGERTIFVVGERLHPVAGDPLPWDRLAECDGVYFTGADPATLVLARRAGVLVVTGRRFEELVAADVEADVLIASGNDPGERFDLGRLRRPARHVVVTDGVRGGRIVHGPHAGVGYTAVPPPQPPVDTYGAGDTFLAGALLALARGEALPDALQEAAAHAAEAITWRGAYPAGEPRSAAGAGC